METSEKIDKLLHYYSLLEPLEKRSSDLINMAREDGKKRTLIIDRDGKKFEVKAIDLLEEIYHGAPTNARDYLKPIYPEMFKVAEDHEELKNEMVKFCVLELDINPEHIEFKKLINFIIAVVDWRIDKRSIPTDRP